MTHDICNDLKTLKNLLNDRNLTIHTYDEAMANEVFQKIQDDYYALLLLLHVEFKDNICSV
ncbi:nucleotidyltransferase substrate binding protein [Isorropodon fossajaponicum symbiont]|uniref:nucleotidyltransferase substrate binding protein n=1 Tax=Isorropodon fossajaponicum symbiont TaxID=883811 RepID=UPI0019151C98|nr:nucleotidyltransferase substrate binding protein [Isorropodon fossajaponicum symbiont]